MHAQLLSYPNRPQLSRAMLGSPVIATVLARHGTARFLQGLHVKFLPNRTVPSSSVSCWHGKIVSCKRGINKNNNYCILTYNYSAALIYYLVDLH